MGRVMMGCRFEHNIGVGIRGSEAVQEVLVAALWQLESMACCINSVDFASSCHDCLCRGEGRRIQGRGVRYSSDSNLN